MEILRKYCLNDNPVKLQVLSDQAANFPTKCARRRAHPPLPNRIQRAADRSDLALSLNELESGATQAPPPRARLAQTLRVPLITISVFLPHALSPFSLTAVPHSVAAFFPTRQVRHGELRGPQLQRGHARVLHPRYARREPRAVSFWVLESPGPSTTRPHRLSHCVSLTITTPTVSPSPSPSLRRLSHCVSLTITTPTVSPSPSPSLRRLSHCVSLTITTPTVSPSPSPSLRRLSHCVSLTITTPTVSPSPSHSLRRAVSWVLESPGPSTTRAPTRSSPQRTVGG
jgi:hypothetical protein